MRIVNKFIENGRYRNQFIIDVERDPRNWFWFRHTEYEGSHILGITIFKIYFIVSWVRVHDYFKEYSQWNLKRSLYNKSYE